MGIRSDFFGWNRDTQEAAAMAIDSGDPIHDPEAYAQIKLDARELPNRLTREWRG